MLVCFFASPRLDREDFACSLRMMINEGRCKKGKERVRIFIFFNPVDLLKSLVAIAYVDCTAYAPCKQLCVEYTTFARIATYFVRIVQLVHVSNLFRTYTACALEATLCVQCRSVRVKRLNAYVNVRLLRVSDLCARRNLCVRCTTCAYNVRINAYVNVRLLRV